MTRDVGATATGKEDRMPVVRWRRMPQNYRTVDRLTRILEEAI